MYFICIHVYTYFEKTQTLKQVLTDSTLPLRGRALARRRADGLLASLQLSDLTSLATGQTPGQITGEIPLPGGEVDVARFHRNTATVLSGWGYPLP